MLSDLLEIKYAAMVFNKEVILKKMVGIWDEPFSG